MNISAKRDLGGISEHFCLQTETVVKRVVAFETLRSIRHIGLHEGTIKNTNGKMMGTYLT